MIPKDDGITSHSSSISGYNDPTDLYFIPTMSCENSFNYIRIYANDYDAITFYYTYRCNKLSGTGSTDYNDNYTSGTCYNDLSTVGYGWKGKLQCTIDCLNGSADKCSDETAMNSLNFGVGNISYPIKDPDYTVRNLNLYQGCRKTKNGIAARFESQINNSDQGYMCVYHIGYETNSYIRVAIEKLSLGYGYTSYSKEFKRWKGYFSTKTTYIVLK